MAKVTVVLISALASNFVAEAHATSPCSFPSKRCIAKKHRILSSNDTLERIAKIYGVSVSDLLRWNNTNSKEVIPGTILNFFYTPKPSGHSLHARRGRIESRSRHGALPRPAPRQDEPRSKRDSSAADSRGSDETFNIQFVYENIATLVKPYPLKWILRGFGRCVNGKREHQAIDIAGVGPNFGLGTPVRAMTLSTVVSIGRPEDNPRKFGVRDLRPGQISRRGRALPRSEDIPGYGRVNYFTLDHGSARTGVVLVTRGMEDSLEGHRVRYMHLAAVHPDLQVGSILEPGDEIGLMGSTAILDSPPHVHIDVTTPNGEKLNVGRLLGLETEYAECKPNTKVAATTH